MVPLGENSLYFQEENIFFIAVLWLSHSCCFFIVFAKEHSSKLMELFILYMSQTAALLSKKEAIR